MTLLKPLALILFLWFFTIATHSRIIQPNDINLIVKTCKQTPNYGLCVNYLKSNPRSYGADVDGLALIMVEIIKNKAITTLTKIDKLRRQTTQPKLKAALTSCADDYKAIKDLDVPQAISGLQFAGPKFAEDAASDVSVEVAGCRESFPGNSPLTIDNIAMNDIAVITRAIIRLLL